MTDFADRVREALAAKGMSIRGAARALPYDVAYLSRVLNGKQPPSAKLAAAFDVLLGTDGELAGMVKPTAPKRRRAEEEDGVTGDLAYVRKSVAHHLEHDNRYGGDQIAPAAVQVWRAAQRQLDSGTVPDRMQRQYAAAVAEAAEVAGWLLFDADKLEPARTAFMEAEALARHAGDRPMRWFVQDMIAMMGVQDGRPGEAVRIADELLSGLKVPPRVALLARIRRGRALARMGERSRALNEMEAAWAALGDSISPNDPAWTWWVNELELSGHEGEVFLSVGEVGKALPRIHRAREMAQAFRPGGRGVFYYSVSMLEAYATGRAWRECEDELVAIPALLEVVSSGRNRRRLRSVLRGIARDPEAPDWLLDLTRDVTSIPQLKNR